MTNESRHEIFVLCSEIAQSHEDCGEFAHRGRYGCAEAIKNEILSAEKRIVLEPLRVESEEPRL